MTLQNQLNAQFNVVSDAVREALAGNDDNTLVEAKKALSNEFPECLVEIAGGEVSVTDIESGEQAVFKA